MADRTIEIIVDVADKATGNLDGIKAGLLALDKAAQRMQNRLRAIGLQKYAATVRLIDRVTEAGSRINSFLKRMATKVYNVTMRINDAAFGKIRQVEASLMRLVGRVWTIGVNIRDGVSGKIRGIADRILMGAGEHGPEVVIPLSSSRRGRALDLFEKTAAILGGEAMNFGADEIKDEMPELHDDFAFASREMENISDGASVTSVPISSGSSNSISMGGITINFDISGVENAQDVVEAIKENIAEISDRVAARLAVTMGDIHQNQNLST